MAKDQLLALTTDVDRLLAAGAPAAASSEQLRQRADFLRDLAQRVAALKPVTESLDRVLQAAPESVSPLFLDLLLLSRQLRSSLAAPPVEGPAQPLPESGPWQTPDASNDAQTAMTALSLKRKQRREPLEKTLQRLQGDLRMLDPLLAAVEAMPARYDLEAMDRFLGLTVAGPEDQAVEEALLAIGPGLLPELLALFDLGGRAREKYKDARRLRLICRLDPVQGAPLCRQAIQSGRPYVTTAAMLLLPQVVPPAEVEETALRLCRDAAMDVRWAAVLALANASSEEAMNGLLLRLQDECWGVVDAAAAALKRFPSDRSISALVQVLREALTELDGLPPAPDDAPGPSWPPDRRTILGRWIGSILDIIADRPDARQPEIARFVLPLVEHPLEVVSTPAFQTLVILRVVLPEMVPTFQRWVQQPRPNQPVDVTAWALLQLAAAEPEQSFELILGLAGNRDIPAQLRQTALVLLPRYLPAQADVILPVVYDSFSPKNWASSSGGVITALGQCGPSAAAAVPMLLRLLQRCVYWHWVRDALLQIDPEGKHVPQELVRLLKSRKPDVVGLTLAILEGFGTRARAVIGEVQKLFNHAEPATQEYIRHVVAVLEGSAQPTDPMAGPAEEEM